MTDKLETLKVDALQRMLDYYEKRCEFGRAVNGAHIHVPMDDLQNLLTLARAALDQKPGAK